MSAESYYYHAKFYYDRGNKFYDAYDLERAIEDFTEAIQLEPDNAEYWNKRGIVYRDKGELDRAIEDFNKAISLDSNDSYAWNYRGLAYQDKGELDRAIEDFSEVIVLNPNDSSAWNNRGLAYQDKGKYDRAIEDFNKAIALDPNLPYAWNNRGWTYQKKGELDRAIEDYNKAIALDPNYSYAWDSRGWAYLNKGELDRAIEDLNKAIALDQNRSYPWYIRGLAYQNKGELGRTVSDYRQSLEAAERSGNILDIFWQSWEFTGKFFNSYSLYEDRKTTNALAILYADVAKDSINRSVAMAEKVRSALGSRGSEIMRSLLYQYYAGVDLESRFGSVEKAYNYSEGLRSRGFLEQMGTEAALKLPGIRAEEANKVRNLINSINTFQKMLSSINPQIDVKIHAEAGLNLTKAETELASLDTSIKTRIPMYAELRNPKPVSLSKAQEWCGDTSVVLEYVLWDSTVEFKVPAIYGFQSTYQNRPSINSYCLVITRNGVTPVRLAPGFDYAASINRLRDNIKNKVSSADMERDRNALYNALIKPVISSVPANVKDLVIVPDGILGHLPFDILRENDRSQDLGEKYRITLSPSVSVSVLAARAAQLPNAPIMAFGGALYSKDRTSDNRGRPGLTSFGAINKTWKDLPGTETEVRNLQRLVSPQQNIRVFTGREVSEAQIKSLSAQMELAKYPILHFACHGYFDESDPERSGIVFSEVSGLVNTGEDGYLTIPEIVLLNMNARMVLLSACETCLGVLKRGDGMVGMARAFLVSGVENVGVSLWSIDDDATMEFMTRLYGKVLNERKTFKEAYYLTRNEFRKDPKWSHPYYWAAFTMYE
jgi:CHAT domain-containing protein/Flp pilus assembly protein TadD